MALKIDYTFRHNGITWRSGHFYGFRYRAWSNDPKPLIILFYRITGINPNTGHQWRLLQGVNLNYIPRSHRRLFAAQWAHQYEQSNGNVKFTYDMLQVLRAQGVGHIDTIGVRCKFLAIGWQW